MSETVEIVLIMVLFLGLLAAGMAIPFAIGVPAIVYLLVHGGVPALKGIGLIADELDARVAVFVGPPEFAPTKTNKAALREFLAGVRSRFERVIFEPASSWDADECDTLTSEVGAIASRDPLIAGLSKRPVAYYRMHGPAGHKSRYEDPAIERLAEIAMNAKHEDATYVFTNVDMFADAKRFKKSLKL